MDDCAVGSLEALERPADELVARLREHLDGDVGGNFLVLDQVADEVEIGLGGGREADLDFLEAHPYERVEHAHLALGPHGLDERLVAVSEVDRAPNGSFGYGP